jgi:SM-20-related protein
MVADRSSEFHVPTDITVTLLLDGGHEQVLAIAPNSILLQQLLSLLTEPMGQRSQRIFQIPIQDGQAVLAFTGDRVVGVITQPPMVLPVSSPTLTPPRPTIIPSPVWRVSDFLSPTEHQRLLDWTIAQEAEFLPSTTSTQAIDYRKSLVLYTLPDIELLFGDKIRAALPQVFDQLAIAPFQPSQIETQLTAHNDGHFYRIHNDNGSPDTRTRVLTYVYYFHHQPKAFSGGELRLYDSYLRNNTYVQAESHQTLEPLDNTILFFPSHAMHEVLPIACPSRRFLDSRFTINGWIRQ